jgi:hypothetical protein
MQWFYNYKKQILKARLSPDNGNKWTMGMTTNTHEMPSPPCMNPLLFSLLGKRGIAQ